MAHPQANRQVEVTNQIIIQGLNIKLEVAHGNWVEELSRGLWAYRTTVRAQMEETLFSMVYGIEATIPAEVLIESGRVQVYDLVNNKVQRRAELHFIEEK